MCPSNTRILEKDLIPRNHLNCVHPVCQRGDEEVGVGVLEGYVPL